MSDPALTTSLPWHALGAGQAVERLRSDGEHGLSDGEVTRRAAEHGPNALPEAPRRPLYLVFLRQFKSPLIYILFVAAALAAGMGHWGDAAVILAVVLVNALIGVLPGRPRRAFDGGAAPALDPAGARAARRPRTVHSRRAIWCPATCCCWPPAMPSAPTHG